MPIPSLKSVVRRNRAIFFKIVAALGTLIGAAWAVISLIYPTVIVPWLDPGRLNINITSSLIDRNFQYVAQHIVIEIKNSGNNRIFVPASSYLVKAYKISLPKLDGKQALQPEQEAEKDAAMKAFLSKYSPAERALLKAQADVFRFKKEWEISLKSDKLSDARVHRGRFDVDRESVIYVSLGRMQGINSFLEPGESIQTQVVALIPSEYELIAVECKTLSSKSEIKDVVFILAPTPDGLAALAFERNSDLQRKLNDIEVAITESLKGGTYDRVTKTLNGTVFSSSQRYEYFIGASKHSSSRDQPITASTSDIQPNAASK